MTNSRRFGDWVESGRFWVNIKTGRLLPIVQGGALPASDNFTAADGTQLTTYSSNWTLNNGEFDVQSNAFANDYGGGTNLWQGAHWNADTFSDNQYAQVTATLATYWMYIGVSVRCHASNATFYSFVGTIGDSYLSKVVDGTRTALGSAGTSMPDGTVLRIEADGTTITPYRDGAEDGIGAQTDASITSGYAGIAGFWYNNEAAHRTTGRGDSWSAGNLGSTNPAISVTDSITVGEAVTVELTGREISKTESIAVGESVTVQESALQISVSESIGVGESVTLFPHTIATSLKLATVGDSNTDEYRADDARGGAYADVTFNLIEMMVRILGTGVIDSGSWGTRAEPRRTGYEYDWARSNVTAGSSFVGTSANGDIISNGMHTGIASQVTAGAVDAVLIMIGLNDYNLWNGTYDDIYNGVVIGADLTTKENSIVSNITSAVDTIRAAGSVRMVLCTIQDIGESSSVQALYPNATNRQRVTDSINRVNASIRALQSGRGGLAIAELHDISTILLNAYPLDVDHIHVAGDNIYIAGVGDEPHNFALADGHPGTVISGIEANLLVLNTFNTSLGCNLPLMTDAQIMEQAGLLKLISVTDSIAVTESTTVTVSDLPSYTISVTDSITIGESVTIQDSDPQISKTEIITVGETVTGKVSDSQVSVTDSITVGENITVEETTLQISVSDNVTVSEVIVAQEDVLSISVIDNIGVNDSDSIVTLDDLQISITENDITVGDSVILGMSLPDLVVNISPENYASWAVGVKIYG